MIVYVSNVVISIFKKEIKKLI